MWQRIKQASRTLIKLICYKISPIFVAAYKYKAIYGRYPDFKRPELFQEKLTVLKVGDYARNPLVVQCADKYRVRSYIDANRLGGLLNTLIGVYGSVSDIDLATLPESFVVKSNCGCGDVFICKDKRKIALSDIVARFEKRSRFYIHTAEPYYERMKHCIIVEQFLSQEGRDRLIDYKIVCFGGMPDHVVVCYDRTENSHSVACYDCAWKPLLNYRKSCVKDPDFPKPASFDRMLEAAKKLARPFPFVRVDFYDINGEPVFGEMTFTPSAALCRDYTLEAEHLLGEKLQLAPQASNVRSVATRWRAALRYHTAFWFLFSLMGE